MGALDPYRITDELEDALLDVMVSRLEARGNHWFFQKVLREYLDAMDIDAASTVLVYRLRNRRSGAYGRPSSEFLGQGYRGRPKPLSGRGREALGRGRRVRQSGRVPLWGYTRSRCSKW